MNTMLATQLTELQTAIKVDERTCANVEKTYILSLLSKAQSQQPAVAERLYQRAQQQWQSLLASDTENPPQPIESPPQPSSSPIAALLDRLTVREQAADRSATGMELDEYFQQQDEQPESHSTEANISSARQPELRAARRLRQRLAADHTARLLHTALEESPDSPGPLNPQMLATRALTTMKELSPQYFNRFVGYIDNLLYIEQCRTQLNQDNASKKDNKPARKSSTRKPQAAKSRGL